MHAKPTRIHAVIHHRLKKKKRKKTGIRNIVEGVKETKLRSVYVLLSSIANACSTGIRVMR